MEKPLNSLSLVSAENISCDTCDEAILFDFSNETGTHMQIGLTGMLECLAFAVAQGAIPKLPTNWWNHIESRYGINPDVLDEVWVNEDVYDEYFKEVNREILQS